MRMGIKSKIFTFTASLFVIVLLILLVVQTFVIGQFFEQRQLQNIEEAIESLVFETIETPEPERSIYRLASNFSMNHNTPFVIIDPEKSIFEQLNSPGNSILVQTDQGQIYNLIVDGFDSDALSQVENGNWIEFSAFQLDEQNLRAFYLETHGFQAHLESTFRDRGMPNDEIENILTEFDDRPVINQRAEIILNNAQNMDTQGSQKLVGYHGEQIEHFLSEQGVESFFNNDELRVYDIEDQWSATHNRLVVRPVFLPNSKKFLVIAIVSTAKTDSTVAIFQEFYWVNFVVALLISFIATYLYAGRFSKPILHMEAIAKNMANMDFQQKVKVTSKDEIGSLADSLNILSDALQDKIVALEGANSKLTDEIDFKTEQEEIRKIFVANVSHELKTPITIIKGLIEGIKEGLYNDSSHLQSALDEIHRMERMVFDMLEISRYEAKGIELNMSIFSIDESFKRVHQRFKELIKRKDINVHMELDEVFVSGDQDKIEQVIENLMSNAVRYCHKGGTITLKTITKPKGIQCLLINDGDPIPLESIEAIWKPFYRIESSRNRSKGGTGLGLVIVKSILEKHDAKYGVENTKEGVKFFFELVRISES